MKKSIALILCAAMLFSACACTDKTRNTRTTRVTADPSEESTEDTAEGTTKDTTEDASTETTGEPSKVTTGEPTEESTTESASSESSSETTTEATTKATTEATTSSEETSASSEETSVSSKETSSESSDPTSESTAQTSQGPDGNTVLFAKDLTYLPAPIVKEQDLFFFQYGGMKSAQTISKSLPFFDFQGKEYDTVKKAVAETLSRHQEAVNSRYDLAMEEYNKKKSSGEEMVNVGGQFYNILPYRVDSQIISYAIYGSPVVAVMDGDYPERSCEGHSIDVATGAELSLKDVVKDVNGFTKLIEDYLSKNKDTYSVQAKVDILASIKNDTFNFALAYDSLHCLFFPRTIRSMEFLNISAFEHPEIFNMEYFGHTPEYYMLRPSTDGLLYWDFDGDAQVDELVLESSTDDYDLGFAMKISINGVIYNSERDLPDAYGMYSFSYFVNADDGQYLYVVVDEEDVYTQTYIFRIDGTKVSYVGILSDYSSHPDEPFFLNPEEFVMSYDATLIGTSILESKYSLLGNGGMPKQILSYFTNGSRHVTKRSFAAASYDYNTGDIGSPVSIPVSSMFQLESYNPSESTIIFKVIAPNSSLSDAFYISCKYVGDYPERLNGVEVTELFTNVVYAG